MKIIKQILIIHEEFARKILRFLCYINMNHNDYEPMTANIFRKSKSSLVTFKTLIWH